MPAATQDLNEDNGYAIFTGVTWQVQGTLFADKTKQTPVDLSDSTARMQVRDEVASLEVVFEITTSGDPGDRIVLGGVEGTFDIQASAATTALLPPGNYVYDLLITDGGGSVSRELEGRLQIKQSVTR